MPRRALNAASMAPILPLTRMLRVSSEVLSTLRPNFLRTFATLSASRDEAQYFFLNCAGVSGSPASSSADGSSGPRSDSVTSIDLVGSASRTRLAPLARPRLLPSTTAWCLYGSSLALLPVLLVRLVAFPDFIEPAPTRLQVDLAQTRARRQADQR